MHCQMRRFKETALRQGAQPLATPDGGFPRMPEADDFRTVLPGEPAQQGRRIAACVTALARLTKTGRSRISRAIVRDGPVSAGGGSFGP
jgi:hypothetical protein